MAQAPTSSRSAVRSMRSDAYDERVLVREAYDEQVLVRDAWDEIVTN